MNLSIIIPSYNEAPSLPGNIKAIVEYFTKTNLKFEIVIVDDASTDQTQSVVAVLTKQYPEVKYIRYSPNRGKGFAVKTGMIAAQGEFALFMDADLSTPLDQFVKLFEKRNEFDIVIASRALPGSQVEKHQWWLKEYVARAGNILVRVILGLPFKDSQCGFKLFNRKSVDIFRYLTIERWGFDMEILYIGRKWGFKIIEIPVRWQNDPTSLVKWTDYFVVLVDVFRILTNNLKNRYTKAT